MPNLIEILESNPEGLTDSDLAVLADWAVQQNKAVPNGDWKRPYALIREGADLLLRRRARSRENKLAIEKQSEENPTCGALICAVCSLPNEPTHTTPSAVGSGHKFVTFESA